MAIQSNKNELLELNKKSLNYAKIGFPETGYTRGSHTSEKLGYFSESGGIHLKWDLLMQVL